ncbi:DUF3889 domain-containing protein [Pseudalkalibacillus salsuginis]|uniref:DUF3889 domain-containing protein n=1 Tax=Pseudalkalibacillus salsuginis TaxID=2910972 RepID=UPI001F3826FB|nr:DUF3889 domain-containing protein [Pseudalkalibacillus salsuginis]MCF6408587.1 YqzG/YhdC family protein [Pseudalkalibacillus salsuginis]
MKKLINIKMVIVLLLLSFSLSNVGYGQQPDYAQWGKTALQETMKKYPNYKVINYEYDGKVIISEERTQYNFEFILKQNAKEREVNVYVLVNPKNNQLINIHFDEIQDLS